MRCRPIASRAALHGVVGRVLALLLLGGVVAGAPQVRRAQGEPEPSTVLHLKDAAGLPLSDVRLLRAVGTVEGVPLLDPQAPALAQSDAAGGLTLPLLAAQDGDGPLLLYRDGRVPRRAPTASTGGDLVLDAAVERTGRVRWSGGRALAAGRLALVPQAGAERVAILARTDDQGRYAARALPASGALQLWLERTDGRWLLLRSLSAGAPSTDGEPQSGGDAVAPLPRGVRGRLIDAQAAGTVGAPNVALRLVALGELEPDATPGSAAVELRAVTDEQGRFTLLDLRPGAYGLVVTDPTWYVDQPYARTDVPSVGVVREASWFVARRRRLVGTLVTGVDVPGGAGGRKDVPVADALVSLLADPRAPEGRPAQGDAEPVPRARSDAEGRFALESVLPGAGYRVVVAAEGYAPLVTEPLDVLTQGTTTLSALRLDRGWELEVEVRDARGRPLAGAQIEVLAATRPAAHAAGTLGAFARRTTSDAAGRALVGALPAEEQIVRVTAPDHVGVERRVTSPRGSSARRERVNLEAAPALEGTVATLSSGPAVGVRVRAWSRRTPRRSLSETQTGPLGRFRLTQVGTQPVDLEVVDARERRLALLSGVEPGAEPVDVVLPDPVIVAGLVTGLAAGGPVGELRVEAERESPEGSGFVWTVIERQRLAPGAVDAPFHVVGLVPGSYALRARQGELESEALAVLLDGSGRADVRLALPLPGSLAGSVHDGSGRPVLGVRVTLARLTESGTGEGGTSRLPVEGGASRRSAATDDRGSYLFEGLGPGLWRVEAREEGRGADLEVVRMGEGDAVVVRDLSLSAAGAVVGVVLSADGAPMDGALVTFRALEGLYDVRSTRSAGDGGYALEGLLPGGYEVRVEDGLHLSAQREAWVAVAAGERRVLDFRFTGGGRIEGTVTRGTQRAAGAWVSVDWAPDEGSALRRLVRLSTDERGVFELPGLEPGLYRLLVQDGTTVTGGDVILSDGDRTEVALELFEGRLPGRVLDASGRPVAGAEVTARPSQPVVGELVAVGLTDATGRFQLGGLPVGRYDLSVRQESHPTGFHSGAQSDLPGADHPVTVVLGLGATVDVEVRGLDGRAVPGARLSLRTQGSVQAAEVFATTGPSGRVRVSGVPAGSVSVQAYARGVGRAYVAMQAVEGASAQVTLQLETPGALALSLEGMLRDHVERARVELRRAEDAGVVLRRRWLPSPSTQDGTRPSSLVIPDLAPGAYDVLLLPGARHAESRVRVVVRAGEVTRVGLAPETR